jgi:dTDP-glucose 4,6-dehydratase
MKTVLVTGGAGFIGANFLNLLVPRKKEINFVNLDKLTYAGNLSSLAAIQSMDNYIFEQGDICDSELVGKIFNKYAPDMVIHFAAESHVDRSIYGPEDFLKTNIMGTFTLLEVCRARWKDFDGKLFHHVSTDEVYGSLDKEGIFKEDSPYNPSSPYSASKAGADHLVRAYYKTYGIPVKITNCSNNYGPFQFPEKLIPLMILNAMDGKQLPVYGDGKNVRDWLYVKDHCEAIWTVAEKGKIGTTYNIGGNCEMKNIEVVELICDLAADLTGRSRQSVRSQIVFIKDRPGHDLRYAVSSLKIQKELGWHPVESFESGIKKTVDWYLKNRKWVDAVLNGEYQSWIKQHYKNGDRK